LERKELVMYIVNDLLGDDNYRELNFRDYLSTTVFHKIDKTTKDYITLLQTLSLEKEINFFDKVQKLENSTKNIDIKIFKNKKDKVIKFFKLVETQLDNKNTLLYKDLKEFTNKYLENKDLTGSLNEKITFKELSQADMLYIWKLTSTRLCVLNSK
jgi:hypothetical protein